MILSQTAFINQLANDCGFQELGTRPVSTPMECMTYVANTFNGEEYKASSQEIYAYQVILGSLQWLATMTRPDIAYSVLIQHPIICRH